MRWMIDHYYADEPMTALDKALFSFASYNAGPARWRRLRAEARNGGWIPTSGTVLEPPPGEPSNRRAFLGRPACCLSLISPLLPRS